MINAILFVLLKCFLYLKGTHLFARLVVSFVDVYEKDRNVVTAGISILTFIIMIFLFIIMIFLFGFGIYDVVTDVIRMEDLI